MSKYVYHVYTENMDEEQIKKAFKEAKKHVKETFTDPNDQFIFIKACDSFSKVPD